MLIGLFPTHVVIDTRDGMVFNADADGRLFDQGAARAFAKHRNEELLAGEKSYAVFALSDDSSMLTVGHDHRPKPGS